MREADQEFLRTIGAGLAPNLPFALNEIDAATTGVGVDQVALLLAICQEQGAN